VRGSHDGLSGVERGEDIQKCVEKERARQGNSCEIGKKMTTERSGIGRKRHDKVTRQEASLSDR
jgi:hypothetical protein